MEVYTKIKNDFFWAIVIFYSITLILNYFNYGVDDTDKDGFNRSGFEILVDYGTGKEYLYKNGTITERLK